MAMELVNGIPCFNCTDVERAKKAGTTGSTNPQDPLHPSDRISNPTQSSTTGTTDGTTGPVSSPNGVQSSTAVQPESSVQLGVNQPLASGDRGTQVNIAI